ncbi:MAG: hypothetical protein ACR2IJ_07645 [Fluviibacter sp.]
MKAPKISIQIGADTRKLKQDMKKADGIVSKFTTAAKWGLAGVASAAGAAAFKLGVDGVQAAIADQASQVKLATALGNTTKATEAQIKANEEYITQTQLRYGVEDVLLRNSLGKLATVTGSLTKAQEMQAVALDVSAGAGISLEAATTLVTKALQGSFTGFKKLGIVLDENITKNKDGAKAVEMLGKKYEGAASKAADTTQGKLQRLNQAWDETIEGVGQALLPALEDLADWATSPEGGQALTDFVHGLTMLIQGTVTAVETLTGALSDLATGKTGAAFDKVAADSLGGRGAAALSQQGQARAAATIAGSQETYRNALMGISPRSSRAPFSSLYGQAPVIIIQGAVDPGATGRQVKKILNQTQLNAVSPNAGDRRR